MKRYAIVGLFARRLSMKAGRVQAILSRLTEAGIISGGGDSKRYPGDLTEPEIVLLFLALLGERGISTAPTAATEFAALTNHYGQRLDAVIGRLLFGPPRNVSHLIVRQTPPGVSAVVNGEHLQFGAEPPESGATVARLVTGASLSAIAAELQGATPSQADAVAQLVRI